MKILVQKYLAEQGICSRREGERHVRAGHIYVNGKKKTGPKVEIDPSKDKVEIRGHGENANAPKETVLIYKPRGIVCSLNQEEGERIMDVFPQYAHLSIVGRLDKESEGLILLSNDGLITKAVTGPKHALEKEYEVRVREEVFAGKLSPMTRGMRLSDGRTLPAKIEVRDRNTFRITLREGRNHQIRRMCNALHLTVESLKRIRIGELRIGPMRPKNKRVLSLEEVSALKSIA